MDRQDGTTFSAAADPSPDGLADPHAYVELPDFAGPDAPDPIPADDVSPLASDGLGDGPEVDPEADDVGRAPDADDDFDDLPTLIFPEDEVRDAADGAAAIETGSLDDAEADVPPTAVVTAGPPTDDSDVPADDAADGMSGVTGEYIAFEEEAVDHEAAAPIDGGDDGQPDVGADLPDQSPSPFVADADEPQDERVAHVEPPAAEERPAASGDAVAADAAEVEREDFAEPNAPPADEVPETGTATVARPDERPYEQQAGPHGARPGELAEGAADEAVSESIGVPDAEPEPSRPRRRRASTPAESAYARPTARGVYDDPDELSDAGDPPGAFAEDAVGEPVDDASRGGHDEPPSEVAEGRDGYEAAASYGDHDAAETLDAAVDYAEPVAAGRTGGGWTIPLLCAGIAVIACCVVIPQADANRRLAYQRAALRSELEQVQTQVATNDDFLRKLASDPTLAERLAQRQMRMVRVGTKPLPVNQSTPGTSPFDLVQVAPPASVGPYEPVGGRVAEVCYNPRSRLYLMGGGLFLLAAGLVLGTGGRREI